MPKIMKIDRIVKKIIKEKKWFWQDELYFESKIQIGIVKSEIEAFVDGRVYLKSGNSFSCANTFEELNKRYEEE